MWSQDRSTHAGSASHRALTVLFGVATMAANVCLIVSLRALWNFHEILFQPGETVLKSHDYLTKATFPVFSGFSISLLAGITNLIAAGLLTLFWNMKELVESIGESSTNDPLLQKMRLREKRREQLRDSEASLFGLAYWAMFLGMGTSTFILNQALVTGRGAFAKVCFYAVSAILSLEVGLLGQIVVSRGSAESVPAYE
jgi:hypothetical protein